MPKLKLEPITLYVDTITIYRSTIKLYSQEVFQGSRASEWNNAKRATNTLKEHGWGVIPPNDDKKIIEILTNKRISKYAITVNEPQMVERRSAQTRITDHFLCTFTSTKYNTYDSVNCSRLI